jgi:hypothetical protein
MGSETKGYIWIENLVVSRGVVEIERSVVILSAVVGAVASGRQ